MQFILVPPLQIAVVSGPLNYRKLGRGKWDNRWSVNVMYALFQPRWKGRGVGLEAFVPSSDFTASKGCKALILFPGAPPFPDPQVFTNLKALPTQYFSFFYGGFITVMIE